MAQSGSAPGLGPGGPRFESLYSDHFLERVDMTCRGYDPRAVKLPKSVKRIAAKILDDHHRGEFVRDYVRILESELRGSKRTKQ